MTLFERLEDLAYNLRWDWHPPTRQLFHDLSPELWGRLDHNPVALLRRLDREALARVEGLDERVDRLWHDLRDYLGDEATWYGETDQPLDRPLVAYFSAEYGLTECLRIYSGGLGILAGDHLKSASDLGVPLVGVGILYREGYFRQSIDASGLQQETFPAADFDDLPLHRVRSDDGSHVRITIPFPGRQVVAGVWRADVGRVPLYLLDTDLSENAPADRALTSRLYGGDQVMRIAQEVLLGIGGYRALDAMGVKPRAFHMNEGHSAFLGLELLRELMTEEGQSFEEAVATARERTVFTTHTPVAAGHDRFAPALMEAHFAPVADAMGLSMQDLLALGRVDPADDAEPFTMTVLALRLAAQANGVSELHGQVSREMWQSLWPERRTDDVPIGHITNGVHLPSWVHPDVAGTWSNASAADLGIRGLAPEPDRMALWRVHRQRRHGLVQQVRERTGVELNPEALTIGFARRFATYKRATLLFRDPERLARLLGDPERPVQIIFAGKAHPKDQEGKALIRRIVEAAGEDRFRNRIVFVPAYGIDLARILTQGADVWLNNPRRPLEASGTSGMKAGANGVLNVSILDGWWDEAWSGSADATTRPGWAIGDSVVAGSPEPMDALDHHALFQVLEEQVVPEFYDRGYDGIPTRWTARMAESVTRIAPVFNTHRMVREYVERYRRAASPAGASRTP